MVDATCLNCENPSTNFAVIILSLTSYNNPSTMSQIYGEVFWSKSQIIMLPPFDSITPTYIQNNNCLGNICNIKKQGSTIRLTRTKIQIRFLNLLVDTNLSRSQKYKFLNFNIHNANHQAKESYCKNCLRFASKQSQPIIK